MMNIGPTFIKTALLATAMAFVSGPAFAQESPPVEEQAVDGFLYFKDDAPHLQNTSPAFEKDVASGAELTADFVINRPVFSADGLETSDVSDGFIGLFTPRKLDSQIGIWFDADADEDSFDGQFSHYITPRAASLGLRIRSQFEVAPTPPLSVTFNPDAELSFESQSTNIGVNVDYSGFGLNAAFIHSETAFDERSYGFEAGLSYKARSWRTSLQVTGLQTKRPNNFIDLGGLYDPSYAVEFGAAYDLTSSWSLTGGLRYIGNRDRFDFGLDKAKSDSRVFMGTALSF